MTDIAELERRIRFALDRIAKVTERAAIAAPDANHDTATLRAELEAEREANAKLTERVRAIKDRQDSAVTTLERKLSRTSEQLDVLGLEVQRLRKANQQLTEANAALRETRIADMTDPSAINRSLAAELDALRADRRAELAELEDVLAALAPLVGDNAHA
jgi:DNA repair exonuclease SbcCD ATPase subunit